MSSVLEITQLTNGDVVLRDADDDGQPMVSIRFSDDVRDMLGPDLVGVAEDAGQDDSSIRGGRDVADAPGRYPGRGRSRHWPR